MIGINNYRQNIGMAARIVAPLVFVFLLTQFAGKATAANDGPHTGDTVWPTPQWTRVEPAVVGMDKAVLAKARDYALTGGGSGYITRHGQLVMAWGDPRARYDLKSTTKSFGSIALGLAIKDGKLRLEDKAEAASPDARHSAGRERRDRLAGRDHDPASGLADGRVREAGRLHEAAVPPGHAVGLQRFRPELAGRVHHAGLRSRLGGVDVRARVHAAGHPAQRPDLAQELVPARDDRRRRPAGVRCGHPRQRRRDGPDRLPDAARGPVERAARY